VLHVKPSSAGDWSLIGGTAPRAPVPVRTLDYWGQGSEQVRSAALKLQRYARADRVPSQTPLPSRSHAR
jgi:hypothetical protein